MRTEIPVKRGWACVARARNTGNIRKGLFLLLILSVASNCGAEASRVKQGMCIIPFFVLSNIFSGIGGAFIQQRCELNERHGCWDVHKICGVSKELDDASKSLNAIQGKKRKDFSELINRLNPALLKEGLPPLMNVEPDEFNHIKLYELKERISVQIRIVKIINEIFKIEAKQKEAAVAAEKKGEEIQNVLSEYREWCKENDFDSSYVSNWHSRTVAEKVQEKICGLLS